MPNRRPQRKNTLNTAARALRWGQRLSGVETARNSLNPAIRNTDLLSPSDRDLLAKAVDILAGIEQRAWEAEVRSV